MKTLGQIELQQAVACDVKYEESRLEYSNRMSQAGFTLKKPEPNELLLDLDNEEDFHKAYAMLKRLESEIENCTSTVFPSKSGFPHRHMIVRLPFEISNVERIALQAIMGSDKIRELLSLFRVWKGDESPTLLAIKESKK
jgi:hypothetical protein